VLCFTVVLLKFIYPRLLVDRTVIIILWQISTLRFATRMMCISVEPAVNVRVDPVVSDLDL
jgi:hypothetical protein